MAYYPPTGDYVPPDQSYHAQNEEPTREVNAGGNMPDPHAALTLPQTPLAAAASWERSPGPRWDRIALLVGAGVAIVLVGIIILTGRQHTSVTPCAAACAQKTIQIATSTLTASASATPSPPGAMHDIL